jgi:hypothetical protein
MPEIASSQPAPSRPLMLAAAAAGGMVLGGTVALWGYFGSSVFYEMIAAGIAACF